MNNNPYSVLGVNENATDDQIKEAYRNLARKYQEDNYSSSPLSDIAKQKMDELDRAYDDIMAQRGGSSQQSANSGSSSYSRPKNYGRYSQGYNNYSSSQFPDIRANINSGRIDDAETILDGIPEDSRNAEWYFLKGQIQQRRGWFDEAYKNYSTACRMDPQNREYSSAFNSLNNNANGGYRTTHNSGNGCGVCDVCSSLLCADCCCECMGGDLIPGC